MMRLLALVLVALLAPAAASAFAEPAGACHGSSMHGSQVESSSCCGAGECACGETLAGCPVSKPDAPEACLCGCTHSQTHDVPASNAASSSSDLGKHLARYPATLSPTGACTERSGAIPGYARPPDSDSTPLYLVHRNLRR